MHSLHPAALHQVSRSMRARTREITPCFVGADLLLERCEGQWVLEIPVRVGTEGGMMIGVPQDQVVQPTILQGLLPGYRVLGVADDGRVLVSDGTLRLWARPVGSVES